MILHEGYRVVCPEYMYIADRFLVAEIQLRGGRDRGRREGGRE